MINPIDIKERIAIGEPLTPEQRDFVLDCINAAGEINQLRMERDALANWQRNALKEMAPKPELEIDAPNYLGRIDALWAFLSRSSSHE